MFWSCVSSFEVSERKPEKRINVQEKRAYADWGVY